MVLLLGQGWKKRTAYRSLCPQAKSSQSTGYVSQPASVSVIPTLGRLSLQAREFKVSLGCLNETLSQEAESAVYLQKEFSQEIRKAAGKSSQDLRIWLPSADCRALRPFHNVSFPFLHQLYQPQAEIDRLPPRQEESGTSQVHVSGTARWWPPSAEVSIATPRPL